MPDEYRDIYPDEYRDIYPEEYRDIYIDLNTLLVPNQREPLFSLRPKFDDYLLALHNDNPGVRWHIVYSDEEIYLNQIVLFNNTKAVYQTSKEKIILELSKNYPALFSENNPLNFVLLHKAPIFSEDSDTITTDFVITLSDYLFNQVLCSAERPLHFMQLRTASPKPAPPFSVHREEFMEAKTAVTSAPEVVIGFDLDETIVKYHETLKKIGDAKRIALQRKVPFEMNPNLIVLNDYLVIAVAEMLNAMDSILNNKYLLITARPEDAEPHVQVKIRDVLPCFASAVNKLINREKHPTGGITFLDSDIYCLQHRHEVSKKIVLVYKRGTQTELVTAGLVPLSPTQKEYDDLLPENDKNPLKYDFSRSVNYGWNDPTNKSLLFKHVLIPKLFLPGKEIKMVYWDDHPDQMCAIRKLINELNNEHIHLVHIKQKPNPTPSLSQNQQAITPRLAPPSAPRELDREAALFCGY